MYSRHDDTVTPIKASTLHPDLTKQVLEPYLGKFTPSPVVENYFDENDNYLGSNYPQEYVYDVRAHMRDIGASSERREERADAREALKARYNAMAPAGPGRKWIVTRSGNVFTVCQVSLPGGVLRSGQRSAYRYCVNWLITSWRWRDGRP
ncbi:hypothetical protein ACLBOM_36980 [Escherichia coli]